MSDDSVLPPVPPSTSGSSSSGDDTLMLILAYLGILALIPLLVEKNKPNVQWHAKHGLVLTVTEIVLWVGLFIVTGILAKIIPFLGCIALVGYPLISLGILVLHIMCILKALKGEKLLIPHLSQYADRF